MPSIQHGWGTPEDCKKNEEMVGIFSKRLFNRRSIACCLFLCVSVDIDASGGERERVLLTCCQDGRQKEKLRQTRTRGADAGP